MNIKQQLQEQIELLFEQAGAPHSRAAYELREELLANCMERYEDLTGGGMEPEAALASVVESIGNVDELIRLLPGDAPDYTAPAGNTHSYQNDPWEQEDREKSALTITLAVGLYILAGVVFFVGSVLADTWWEHASTIGLTVALAIAIIPTCMLVYRHYSRPRYQKQDETVVEDFKKWSSDSKKRKGLFGALTSCLWTLTTLAYLAIGFLFNAWHPGWMIFLAAMCVEAGLGLIFKVLEMRS